MAPRPSAGPSLCASCSSRRKATTTPRKRTHTERRSSPEALERRAEARRFYASPEWKATRDHVRKRDGACLMCGTRRGLTVDHVIPRRDAPELAFDLENLRTLCRSCHGRVDGGRSVLEGRASARPVGKPSRGDYGMTKPEPVVG